MGSPNEKGAGATVGTATRMGGDFSPRRGVTFSPQVRALQRALQRELQPAERAQAPQTFSGAWEGVRTPLSRLPPHVRAQRCTLPLFVVVFTVV